MIFKVCPQSYSNVFLNTIVYPSELSYMHTILLKSILEGFVHLSFDKSP